MLHCITARRAGHPSPPPGMAHSATPARYASPGLPAPCTPIPAPPLVRLYASLLLAGLAGLPGCATMERHPYWTTAGVLVVGGVIMASQPRHPAPSNFDVCDTAPPLTLGCGRGVGIP